MERGLFASDSPTRGERSSQRRNISLRSRSSSPGEDHWISCSPRNQLDSKVDREGEGEREDRWYGDRTFKRARSASPRRKYPRGVQPDSKVDRDKEFHKRGRSTSHSPSHIDKADQLIEETWLFDRRPDRLRPDVSWKLQILKDNIVVKNDIRYLHRKSCYLIGRNTDSDIPLDEQVSSGRHAAIVYRAIQKKRGNNYIKQLRLYIWDFGSRNGTYINGELIRPECYRELKKDDRIKFGKGSRLDYHLLHEE